MIALFVENHIIDNAAVDNWVRHETKETVFLLTKRLNSTVVWQIDEPMDQHHVTHSLEKSYWNTVYKDPNQYSYWTIKR